MGIRAHKTRTGIRRDQIAQSALTLMAQRGLHRLSVAGVARQVGVVPSDIYRHFSGKDQVMAAALELIGQRLRANLDAVVAESPDALERLGRLLRRHVELVRGAIPIPRIVFSEETFAGPPARRRQVYRIFRQYLAGIKEVIAVGQAAGQIRRDLDAAVVSVMFLGLVQPAAILWLMSKGTFRFQHQVEEAWQIFRRTIQNPRLSRQPDSARRPPGLALPKPKSRKP
jgi:AcrR family transcriptional regulator